MRAIVAHGGRVHGDEMDSFARFIPDRTGLDAGAIRAAGLAALPFPEVASHDEIVAVGRLVGAERAELWSHGHRQEPRHFAGLGLDEAARHAFDLGHDSVLIAFEAAQAHIWLPAEHEFFVIFAPQPTLQAIRAAGIFTYDFDAYAREAYFRGPRSDHLVETGKRYTIVPA